MAEFVALDYEHLNDVLQDSWSSATLKPCA
jgi:hypothetical protein